MSEVHIHRPRVLETFVQVRELRARKWRNVRTVKGGDRATRLAAKLLLDADVKEVRAVHCYEYYEPLVIWQAAKFPYPKPSKEPSNG